MSVAIKSMGYELNRQKILFIDNDLQAQLQMKILLESDFEVICESSGLAAVEIAESVLPHLVLLDLNMPNIDAFELLKQMKSHPTLSKVPVLCVNGEQDQASRHRAYKLGAAGYMEKPLNADQMSSDIRALVKNMNMDLLSVDRTKKMFIGLDPSQTGRRFQEELSHCLNRGEKVLVINFDDKNEFQPDRFQMELESGHLIFLNMKAEVFTKLLASGNISHLIMDIENLVGETTGSHLLFFQNPESVVGLKTDDQATATAILLSETVSRAFRAVRYFSTASQQAEEVKSLNSMAKLLVGNMH